jgi:hypothetical protein
MTVLWTLKVHVTSLNLCICKTMGFQKLDLKLCANEINKDAFFPFSPKS